MENNKNFIIAIVLSLAVLLGWQFLYVRPMQERARQQQEIEAMHNPPKPATSGTTAPSAAGASPGLQAQQPGQGVTFPTREAALAATPRVPIDSPALTGSINLKGGRIDDVVLKHYKETVDPQSPNVVLLSPS